MSQEQGSVVKEKNDFEQKLQHITELEKALGRLSLDENGKIIGIDTLLTTTDRPNEWIDRPGVIDSKIIFGCQVVIFNSNILIPAGANNLFEERRSGEYDPDTNTVYVDLKDSWNFLHDRYQPQDLSPYLSHELRHALIYYLDQKQAKIVSRYDGDEDDPQFLQLSYLDELHSQYFDYLSGHRKKGFASINDSFYSVAGHGSHLEIVPQTPEIQEQTQNLFLNIQFLFLLQEYKAHVVQEEQLFIDELLFKCGAILAIARDIPKAAELVRQELNKLKGKSYLEGFKEFIVNYQPQDTFAPRITSEPSFNLS